MLKGCVQYVKNMGIGRRSFVDEYPQNEQMTTFGNYQTVYNSLFIPVDTRFYTQTFPQDIFTSYRRHMARFTHLPHPLLLSLLFIN